MDGGERLSIDDVVTILRAWRANELWGSITVNMQEGRVVSIRPQPIIRTVSQLRRHLPEVKQTP